MKASKWLKQHDMFHLHSLITWIAQNKHGKWSMPFWIVSVLEIYEELLVSILKKYNGIILLLVPHTNKIGI
jgi:hypothetical protein